jgi:hypothetical protein
MRAEHLAPGPAAGAAIACAFFALGLMLLRQMARQEQVLREILRKHQELLESSRLLILTQQETLEKQRLYDLEHPDLVCALFLSAGTRNASHHACIFAHA